MNKGILELALTGTIDLELEYRNPGEAGDLSQQQPCSPQQLRNFQVQTQIDDGSPGYTRCLTP